MLPAEAADNAVLTMWANSPHFAMPSIKIGAAMLSAAVPSLHAYHLLALGLFDSTFMLEEEDHRQLALLYPDICAFRTSSSSRGYCSTTNLHF